MNRRAGATRCMGLFVALIFGAPLSLGSAKSPVTAAEGAPRVEVSPVRITPGSSVTIYYSNPDMSGRDVFAHYGFNGWSLALTGDGATSVVDLDNVDHYVHRKMRYDAREQRYELEINVPSAARALHMAFCWSDCASGDWDNRSGKDYAWPIVFPYIGPVLTWNESTSPGRGIVIQVEHPIAELVHLRYGPRGGAQRVVTSAEPLGLRRFVLTGLNPGTEYTYALSTPSGHRFDGGTFKTLPTSPTSVRFLVFGDAQDDGETGRFSAIAAAMARDHNDAQFIVSTGDMPWNDFPGHWWTFFDKARPLLASRAFMPVAGNHDTPGNDSSHDHRSFTSYFSLPQVNHDKAHYRFDVGSVAFFAMNSERREEFSEGATQYEWLKGELSLRATNPGYRGTQRSWTFVYWHVPPYNVGARHFRQQDETRGITRLFDGVVDWTLAGHEHLGQRFRPLRYGGDVPRLMPSYGLMPSDGVGYAVVPGSGISPSTGLIGPRDMGGLRDFLAFPSLRDSDSEVSPWSGYAKIDIDGSRMTLSTFRVSIDTGASVLVDQVRYQKTAAGGP